MQYHPPIAISQDEIKTMTTIDESGRTEKASSGRIKDCATMKTFGENKCAYIICKDDRSQPTGLTCDYFIPKSEKTALLVTQSGKISTKDLGLQNKIKNYVAEFESGKPANLENFCNQDTVVCYFKAKPFPMSKKPSTAKLSRLIHKESSLMNSENLEVSVFND